jgi:ATP-dependent DNA helicase DinG
VRKDDAVSASTDPAVEPDEAVAPRQDQVRALLAAAVEAVGGSERPGQVDMAEAVAHAMTSRRHLLVQAGTGTGKSLAYLVPSLLHDEPVIVATATIALQTQLVERDLPRLVDAVEPLLGRRPSFAVLKGRANYVCLHRLKEGAPDDDQETMFAPAGATPMGRDVTRLREWADETDTGDRLELVPAVDDRVWRAHSVSSRECIGAQKCPYSDDCFSEKAREKARESEVVVTNHALLAIGGIEGIPVLPEHDVVVVDEAHELVDRATSAATVELTTPMLERAARRASRHVGDRIAERLEDAVAAFSTALLGVEPGRITQVTGDLEGALTLVRDSTHAGLQALATSGEDADKGARIQARAELDLVHDVADRLVGLSSYDVAWLSEEQRRGRVLRVAPLSVGGLLRESLFTGNAVVLTSATMTLGGSFEPLAKSVGLGPLVGPDADQLDEAPEEPGGGTTVVGARADGTVVGPAWTALDVGSPFAYERQGILYTARHLPRPGRDGLTPQILDELAELIEASGGRALGLFSSRRAVTQAADAMRSRLDVPVLAQGDDSLPELLRRFADEPETCLFGTLSLWQGVDVPGSSCHLVVIDRIPFPRPDEPLVAARQKVVDDRGGNGFMAVSVPRAALLLAQGVGRLIRTDTDRGVVAVLDSRLATAGYGGYLRASLPPFWWTTDGAVVRSSLEALRTAADAALPVAPEEAAAEAPSDVELTAVAADVAAEEGDAQQLFDV